MNSHPNAGRWDDVPLSPAPPIGDEYIELPESGWGGLVGWCAGPARLIRVPDQVEAHITTVTRSSPAGDEQYSRPRTYDEQAIADADINDYLHACGAPARPTGYRWFLRLPAGYSEDRLWSDLIGGLPSSAIHPADIAPRVDDIVRGIYADAGR
ncbi:hypothetical protein C5N14_28200 [Micromonospora sp. MW-13]|uniref:DUF5956 family protein n=1 Tax=unclassified Micromonospora TaxID=2617518 RepID=UPI000EE2909E|nr:MULTISPECIES: DUF5956 family protein [unclassified Micromonospora]MCX4471412.1 DUF5956 family protein [Micromonospora sp. NBC_01655]RGC65488.1 hypothetical protein C5N14_28200 [Micromonospora sp. MW-13]